MFEQAKDSKATLFDNVDAFGKQQSKIKQEKGDRKIYWHQKKGKRGNKLMSYLIFFSIIVGKVALGKEIGGLFERNRIEKGSLTPLHQNALSKEETTNKQIDSEAFRAYKCDLLQNYR